MFIIIFRGVNWVILRRIMKITIIIGSNQNANISTSYKISEMVRESLMNLGNEVEIMELSKYKLICVKGAVAALRQENA